MRKYENQQYNDLYERNTARFAGDDGVEGAKTRRDSTSTVDRKGNPMSAVNVGVQKPEGVPKTAKKPITSFKGSGGGGGSDSRDLQLGADLDPKSMMKKEGYKKGGKVKKYADGGMTQQPTYPFYGNTPQAGGQNGGMNQTFNMQPQATADANQQPQRFKKGGKVSASKMGAVKVAKPKMSSASSRADGIAIRGKTRA
jgi:hypothetical protein